MLTPSERRLSDQADRARARGDHLGADRLRRELFAEQARRYRPGGDPGGPGPSVESQAAHIEGAAHVAPKPLASKLARLKERTRSRRRVVREAGHLESVGVAVTPSGHDPGGIGLQSPPALKLWPTLAQRCLKKRRDRQYRVWVLARSLPGAGRGCVRVAELSELIEREKIGGLSPGTLRRLINSGAGTFWKVFYRDGDKWLELRGLGSVCLALGVERLSSAPVLIPTRWAKTLRAFRAACYASGFPTSAMSNPISRRVIEAQIGKTARTQRGYDAALLGKVRKQDNAQHVGNPKHGDEIQRGYYLDKVSLPDGTEEIALFKRLPNSFQVGFERGRRGMMRRVNRQLRYPVRNEGTGKREKLFYRDAKSVNRRLECNQDDFLYQLKTVMRWPKPVGDGIPRKPKPISITCQTRGGADLWEGVHKVGGLVIR